ncbi:tetratricopeptide repeat protein [Desulfoluna sp.]|uniref:tetratricopeptide repeat protein n=1 Tax=Desulfoluna sp. TaxID=2045199 RepID=UPI00262EA615|nr:tetratricopeptide repeat protein [Desulfoluna sp.]
MQKESPQAVTEKDRFVVFFEKTVAFAKANRTQVSLGVAGVVLLLAIVSGVGLSNQRASGEASLAFQALKSDFQALEASEGREMARARWLGEAPDVLRTLKRGASSYAAALLWYGGLAYENGDFELASGWYGTAAGSFRSGSSLLNIAWCGQGQALEQQGKLAEAVPLYEKIRKSALSVKREEATFLLARIKESQGDTPGAEVLYRDLAESDSASVYKKLAADKVAGL